MDAREPDEDDVRKWFVKLHYAGAAVEHVDIQLSFPADGLPPTVSVLQPRLVAPFIHHGALCSYDLMSTAWQLTKESVVLLLMALHRSLDVGDPRSGVTLDAASQQYTTEERQRGQARIHKAHEEEFRALAGVVVVDEIAESCCPFATADRGAGSGSADGAPAEGHGGFHACAIGVPRR